jgi:aryl-alcohol dehydrogenase-like predicted oxidoreductase
MELRQLGSSTVYVPAIAFGAWAIDNWGIGSTEKKQAIAAIRTAYELGYTAIDTAPIYGLGHSETVVAEAIRGLPRDHFRIFTKCGPSWRHKENQPFDINALPYQDPFAVHDFFSDATKAGIIRQCEDSLRRLKTDYVDLYSLHWPDPGVPIEESMEALATLLQQGKIRAAGLGNHSRDAMERGNKVVNLSANKVRYSLLNRGIEADLVPYCLENSKSILAYTVLQRGLLIREMDRHFIWAPAEENPLELALYKPANLAAIKQFREAIQSIGQDYGLTLSQLCINWTANRPAIAAALIGATSPEDVRETVAALAVTLSESDLLLIMEHLAALEDRMDLSVRPYTYDYDDGIVRFQ